MSSKSLDKRTIKCEVCGEMEVVDWNSNRWSLENCPKCEVIKTAHPAVYEWVQDVIRHTTISESRVQSMIDYSLRPPNSYY